MVFTKTGITLNFWRTWVPQIWNSPHPRAGLLWGWAGLCSSCEAYSLYLQLMHISTPDSSQDGVRLQYNKSLLSHEPSDHWQALGWICIHHTVCVISHLHTCDSIWIEISYLQLSNLQRSLVITHLNPDILMFWLLSFLFQLDALAHILPSHLKSLCHEIQICCIIIAEQWWR